MFQEVGKLLNQDPHLIVNLPLLNEAHQVTCLLAVHKAPHLPRERATPPPEVYTSRQPVVPSTQTYVSADAKLLSRPECQKDIPFRKTLFVG